MVHPELSDRNYVEYSRKLQFGDINAPYGATYMTEHNEPDEDSETQDLTTFDEINDRTINII